MTMKVVISPRCKSKPRNTDFTLREPNLKKLHDAWCRKSCKEELQQFGDPTETRKFWREQIRDTQYIKVVLLTDIHIGKKRVAKKGDTVWAERQPYFRGGLMVKRGTTKKQIEELRAPKYIVRILAPRKLDSRPMYEGEPFHWNVAIKLTEARKVAVRKK